MRVHVLLFLFTYCWLFLLLILSHMHIVHCAVILTRAYLSTVKLQMQRLNCHSQLISNSMQFSGQNARIARAIDWMQACPCPLYLYSMPVACHTGDFLVWKIKHNFAKMNATQRKRQRRRKKWILESMQEDEKKTVTLQTLARSISFIKSIPFLHCKRTPVSTWYASNLSEDEIQIVSLPLPFQFIGKISICLIFASSRSPVCWAARSDSCAHSPRD